VTSEPSNGGEAGDPGASPPPKRLLPPHPRHYVRRVTQRTRTKRANSVIESRIDVAADIAAINAGRAVRATVGGVVQYLVNGRSYGVEPTGRAYPISGPGIHQLDRLSFKAIGVYNTFGPSE
jgi:hypothetical protein